jgi:hypothetical protein
VPGVAGRGGGATVRAAVRYVGGDLAPAALPRPWVVVAVARRSVANVRGAVRIVRR